MIQIVSRQAATASEHRIVGGTGVSYTGAGHLTPSQVVSEYLGVRTHNLPCAVVVPTIPVTVHTVAATVVAIVNKFSSF